MKSSSSSGVGTVADSPGRSCATAGRPAMFGLDVTTLPASSRTCTSCSSWVADTRAGTPGPDSSCAATSAARTAATARIWSVSPIRSIVTSSIAPRSRTAPTTSTAATVERTRTVPARCHQPRRSAAIDRQPVSHAPYGLDRLPAEGPVQLVAQAPHVHLDDVRIALEVVVPDVREDLPFGDDLALAPQQELQKG